MGAGARRAEAHMTRTLAVRAERWPIAGHFTIARGAKTEAAVVVVEIAEDGAIGRGECVPYARYGESVESVVRAIEGLDPRSLDRPRPTIDGAARSAIDLALWELEARRAGSDVATLAGLARPERIASSITISIDTPAAVERAAAALADRPVLKLKLAGDEHDLDRARAVRSAAPASRLWVDANESWDEERYRQLAPQLAALGVALLEQPLPAGRDRVLAELPRPLPVCADESAHDAQTIPGLADRYDVVNVKLDKAGGLTGAIEAIDAARGAGLGVALGCMVCTSLAIAPACLLADRADWVDLDGSILLARDRDGGARIDDGWLIPPSRALWGG
jgi:L-alanine-DL-glutamate epimerase-like enolase superfamily enzyme